MRLFQRIHHKLNWSFRRYMAVMILVVFVTYLISALYQMYKPLPDGLSFQSEERTAAVEFLSDQTFLNAEGKLSHDQQIFDRMLELIESSQTTIVLDMFLFNAELGESKLQHRKITEQLTQALINKKRVNPQIEIKLITDPINTVYGGVVAGHLEQLETAGIDVIHTDLLALRASNPMWSGFWYMCCQALGNNNEKGWLPNPFGQQKITLRSYLALMNFKANHRKALVVDTLEGWKALISSANPHDASSQHSNVAMVVTGRPAIDVLDSERAVAKLSNADMPMVIMGDQARSDLPRVQILTEKAILDKVLTSIDDLKSGEQLNLMMFYLSERKIIKAIKNAHLRGVNVRVLLDPSKDAFGMQKNGVPNRQVAWELDQVGIPVRWCHTHGEQCHSKLLVLTKKDSSVQVILGSANYTARNLKNYNLESNISVTGRMDYPALVAAKNYIDIAWTNPKDRQMSVGYEQYKDDSRLKYWSYRFMEWSGISTF